MSDVISTKPVGSLDASVMQERRRPGRIEDASPELIQLLRNPASREARMRVALYDAPGFLLPASDAARRPQATALKVTAAIVASGAAWGIAFKAMCLAWG